MRILLAVGAGSFIGGVSRYVLSQFVQARYLSHFPYATLLVNVIGCFLIGLVFGISDRTVLHPDWKIFLTTGILGGFTTFSAFSNETVQLLRSSQYMDAALYSVGSVGSGILATFLGILLCRLF